MQQQNFRCSVFLFSCVVGILIGFFFNSTPAHAYQGFVKVNSGEEIFVDFRKPQPGFPTVVLLNGLTYSQEDWLLFRLSLMKRNPQLGILAYDMKGMGRTLLRGKLPVNYSIPYLEQIGQLNELLNYFHLSKVHLVGLSYGGAIAVAFGRHYPEHVASLILMAPFTEPLKGMDQWIRTAVNVTNSVAPYLSLSNASLYDFYLRHYVYTFFPELEPSVLSNPFKLEAIFRMVQGIRHYKTLNDAENLPNHSVHLLIASQDEYIADPDILRRFWNAVPVSAQASRLFILESRHKIPEVVPDFSAAWVNAIVNEQLPELWQGKTFEGSAAINRATSGQISIDLH